MSQQKNKSEIEMQHASLWRWGVMAFALIGVALYLPTLSYKFTYDDRLVIEMNSRIRDLGQPSQYLGTSYWNSPGQDKEYRPLALMSYAVNWAFAEKNPVSYRVINLLLHGAVILLLGMLTRALSRSDRVATVAAGLFALHPIHVEVVAGVVGRAELMASTGFFGGLLCAWHSMNANEGASRWRWAAATGACAALAVGSKENGLTLLPAMALLPLAMPIEGKLRPEFWVNSIRAQLPSFITAGTMAVIYLGLRIVILGGMSGPPGVPQVVAYDNPLVELEGIARTLSALKMLGRYALMLVWPFNPSPDYSLGAIPLALRLNDPSWIFGALLGPIFLWALWAMRRRPMSLIGIMLFFVTFILTSNLMFPIGVMLAERLLYLPSAGFCLLVADLGVWGVERLGVRGRKVIIGAAIAIALAFTIQTLRYMPKWKDNAALFEYMVNRVPGSARANSNYSLILIQQKKYAEAEAHLKKALEISPGQPLAMAKLGEIYYRRGTREDKLRALELLEGAFLRDPGSMDTVKYLTRIYVEMKQPDRAEAVFTKSLESHPNNHAVRADYGRFLEMRQRHPEAIEQLEKYLRESGEESDKWVFESLGRAYKAMGDAAKGKMFEDMAAPLAPPSEE